MPIVIYWINRFGSKQAGKMLGQMDLSGQGSWFDCLRISKETWVEVVMSYRTEFTAKGKSDRRLGVAYFKSRLV